MTWTLIHDKKITKPADAPNILLPLPFTWLRIWEAIVGDGQILYHYEYSKIGEPQ